MSMPFEETASRAFSFLEATGFRRTKREPGRVRYESDQVFVVVEWDARSGELQVFFGLQPGQGGARDAYSLTDLLSMQGVDVAERRAPFQVAEESRLQSFVERLAEDTRCYAQRALTGERMFYRQLQVFRTAQAQEYLLGMELERVRAEADGAWKLRQLDKVIELYTTIADRLTRAEKARLTYAKRHRMEES